MLARTIPTARRAFSAEAVSVFSELSESVPTLAPGALGPSPSPSVTTLSNGVRVVSVDDGSHVSSVGAFVRAGSRYETAATRGAARVLKHSGFKSTTEKSALRFFRDMEDAGVVSSTESDRETLIYRVDALRDGAHAALGMVADTLLKPYLPGYEITESNALAGYDAAAEQGNLQAVVGDMVHEAAFGRNAPLGIPAVSGNFGGVSGDAVRSFRESTFAGDRVVIAGTGVDHESFVRAAETLFDGLPAAGTAGGAATYVGGDKRVEASGDDVHVAIALNTATGGFGAGNEKTVLSSLALHTMLGGGLSTSGARLTPGDGASSFAATYSDAGIVGVFGSSDAAGSSQLVSKLCGTLKGAAAEAPTEAEVSRARNQLKATVAQNLSTRGGVFSDLGTQVLNTGGVQSSADLYAKIDSITAADIQGAAKVALASKPTVVSVGNIDNVPSFESIEAMLK
eukprot:g2810.t1